ncbi:dihydropyrimidinase [Aestuariirhabdus litorea]|uniref:Dihydropyrimidinase n=1 Tax=Aestuariirhabdus litorea TaxID=2528527 RepID=A0A3P3VKG8_9GAMM|nr:dihydropyrimidinase [Aestuariirhabdus litorea]RRJ82269.1 dihydropyrimidinase [Aestuariirhabdus litorea]RWW92435.1 dihydropyrimidinase [Endozoicomonadaceae bacterium GTF-13]
MKQFDTIIRGGTVVTAADTIRCDVGIRDGIVTTLGADLQDEGAHVINASGLLVMPGGIDSHIHLDQPSGPGIVMADGFDSGTLSALCGGNTTVIPFAFQDKGQSLREAVKIYHDKAEGQSWIDHSFHMIISDPTKDVLECELPAMVDEGYTSYKVFMTYEGLRLDDRQILDLLEVARRHGAFIMVHAEGYDTIRYMVEKLEAEGRTEAFSHALSRPQLVEREATHRAISLAEFIDVPMLLVHVSAREAMEQIRWGQQKGLKIYGETCPQYLMLTQDDLDREGQEGAKYICSPPPRDRDSQEACWEGLQQNVFQVFSSDHCPFLFEGTTGKLREGEHTSFCRVANGVPGVETRLPILFSEGVSKGRIDLNRFVALSSTNHAKLYGMYPKKGTIAVGSDADIALWDPIKKVTITHEMLHSACDYTPYEGVEITGWPVTVLSRGVVVLDNGKVTGKRGHGQYQSRERSPQSVRR